MKNCFIKFVFIVGTIFSQHVSASDTLSIDTIAKTPIITVLNNDVIQKSEHNDVTNSSIAIQVVNRNKRSGRRSETNSNGQNGTNSTEESELNPLLNYIQNYNINANKAFMSPPREISPYENIDDLKMSPFLMPLVFNKLTRNLCLHPVPENEPQPFFHSAYLDSINSCDLSYNYIRKLNESILLDAQSRYIDRIKYDIKTLPQPENMSFYLNSRKQAQWVRSDGNLPGRKADTKYLPKSEYNPWSKSVNVKLQFSQTYNSPNWSKGGESNMAGLTTIYLNANYNDLNNVQFDNNVEAKIGLNTVSSDTLRNLNISTDQLRAVSKLGVRMHNDFYYSLSGEFTTQFLNNYKSNTMTLQSSFMSPAKLFVGLGIDYKKSDKKKGYNLSLLLTPLTSKMSYLYDNVNLKPSSYGIEDGRHFNSELGSKITATLTWKLSDQAQWRSNFYYYTDFTYVDSDWENTLDLNFNNYFATSVYVHLKLDDRLKRDPGESLIQMQELFSFGMVYHW